MISKPFNYQNADSASNLQSNAQNTAIGALTNNPLNSGSLLDSVSLTAGSNSVSHKLGRKLQGYIICGQSAASNIYQESADTTILKLNSSAATNVTLFVF
jgi:spore coat protein U-like protein